MNMLKNTAKTISLLLKYAPGPAITVILITAASAAASPLTILFTEGLTNAVIAGSGIALAALPLLAVMVYAPLCEALNRFVGVKLEKCLSENMAEDILSKFSRLSYTCYDGRETYDVISRMGQNPNERLISAFLSILDCGAAIIALTGNILVLIRLDPLAALSCAVMLIPLILFNFRSYKFIDKLYDEQIDDERRMNYISYDLLSKKDAAYELKIFRAADYILEKWHNCQNRVLKLRTAAYMNSSKYLFLGDLIFLGWTAWLMTMLINRTLMGTVTVGLCTSLIIAVRQILGQVSGFCRSLSGLNRPLIFIDYFYRFMALPETAPSLQYGSFYELRFENVSFAYPGTETEVLKNVNLTLRSDQRTALVGENGCGKSTIVKLLCGLYEPTNGKITVDGKDICAEARMKLFGAVFQDFGSYYLTLRENVAFGNMEKLMDDTAITAALDRADFHKNIDLDQNLGRIDEDGVDLSGGEWQRLALARGYISERICLILDEPTAALDPMAESRMYESFLAMTKNRGSLIISHRLAGARPADKIVVLSGGTIAEQGSHDALLANAGLYKKMWEAQKGWYDDTAV